ncbi:ABC transporter ATP-binding protein [Tengunoibacter tsumagoiensis]|uniref:ABC transporter ATP-binding protein n=1 Tax=Tengunoibacter tsumagoiensis TaxID=2014871 RepID=A0A401ZXX6_9CHLR|nr:ABC transporter ATP-binding protein [Tengunoibacter tsumagoiensis]GCE11690.1 ABC transporter ATP-binding protein [Tengunoibacter tsumagoiensis]
MDELEIQGLVKQFGSELIIDGISFYVRDGEFLVILGPSGGGKSTLLRMICGIESPDKGRIFLKKRDITTLTPQQRNVGMVFQDHGLYPHMNVYDNIAYGLQKKGLTRSEIKQRIQTATDKLGITSLIRQPATTLSGGEQQRVALAKVLVRDADIYLYDEPFSNLDVRLRTQLRHEVLNVHRAKQRPSIFVTHDQNEAFTMADRIAVVAQRRLQQIGTAEELLQAPANTFVAQFIGTPPTNLLRAQLSQIDGQLVAEHNGIVLPLPRYWRRVLKQTVYDTLILGIRPTSIIPEWLFPQLEKVPSLILPATVRSVESLYAEVNLTLTLGKDTVVTATYQQGGDPLPTPGKNIRVAIETAHLQLFDPTTGKSLNRLFT